MVDEDTTVQDLTKEQQNELINKLIEHRELKTKGVRANNVAAARDMTATSDAIIKEVSGRAAHSANNAGYSHLFSSTTLRFALGPTDFFSSHGGTSMIRELPHIMVVTTQWISSKMFCIWTQTRFVGCLSSGPVLAIKVSTCFDKLGIT